MSTNINEFDRDKVQAEITNLNAMTAKLHAENEKIHVEIKKISAENKWYPAIIASSATLAIVAVVKLFL